MGIQERKQREKEQRKDAILSCAEKIFLKKGLAGATMNDVADACELSKATLYLYYKNKEELYLTVIYSAMLKLAEIMEVFSERGTNPLERFLLVGAAYIEYFKRYPGHFTILLTHSSDEGLFQPELAEIGMRLMEANQRIWAVGVDNLKKGMEEGVFKSDINPYEIELMYWTTSNGVLGLQMHMQNSSHEMLCDAEGHEAEFMKIDLLQTLHKIWNMISRTVLVHEYSDEEMNSYFNELSEKASQWPDSREF